MPGPGPDRLGPRAAARLQARLQARLRTGVMALAGVGALAGCAGATVGSGVGEARLEHAPYYAGRNAGPGLAVAYAPVAWQRGAAHDPIFDPKDDAGTPVARLLEAMNATLDSLMAARDAAPVAPPGGTPPDVDFGCDTDATDACLPPDDEGVGRFGPGRARMRLAVGRPSSAWTAGAAAALEDAGADALLLLTLEVGRYWPRQTNWRGSKAVELGTDHTVGLPWLTSLETPVAVLQLTGALVGRDGKAIRIGAEGIGARRAPILLAGFGAEPLIGDEDVERLMDERRDDLPGRPRVWEAALRTLVGELAGERARGPATSAPTR